MWEFVLHELAAAAVPFLTGLVAAAVNEWLRNKALADRGAVAERTAQDEADAKAAAEARKTADEIHGLSDDDFDRRAGAYR